MMMMMPSCRERGGKKHTTMDALLSLFDVSLSLSLFLAPQILLDKERKKEKKTAFFFFFFFFFFFSFPPKRRTTDEVERRFDRWSVEVSFQKWGGALYFETLNILLCVSVNPKLFFVSFFFKVGDICRSLSFSLSL